MNNLWSKLNCPKIKIIDIGAMDLGECVYKNLVEQGGADIIGFEPNREECERLNREGKGLYYPYFIGNGGEASFFHCNCPMTSSIYEPNTELLKKFQNLAELTTVIKKETVQTTRISSMIEMEIGTADFLKIDIQGGELGALRGAELLLSDILVIQTEVLFLEMYCGQSFFSDIDIFLRGHGFQFHRFANKNNSPTGRAFKPARRKDSINTPISQCLWADAVYVRDFMDFGDMEPEKLLKIAAILHDCYRSWDFVNYALMCHDKKTGKEYSKRYQEQINKGKRLS